MKRRILSILLVVTMLALMVACGTTNENGGAVSETEQVDVPVSEPDGKAENSENDVVVPENGDAVSETEQADTPVSEVTDEVVHEHDYVENVVTEATCTTDGTTSFTCSCGDTYDEAVPATGHNFDSYVADGNATYLADGTKTAKCGSCEATDTVVDEGSKLNYTYTDCEAVKYAQQTVNVRSGPSTDFEKVGSLSTNQEVTVTGTCNETGWYRIVLDGSEAYVSNKYLGDSKVEIATSGGNSGGGSVPAGVPNALTVERNVWHDMGTYKFYVSSYYLDRQNAWGMHLNTSEDLWAWATYSDPNDAALGAFIRANGCHCGEPTHGGLYPERGGN